MGTVFRISLFRFGGLKLLTLISGVTIFQNPGMYQFRVIRVWQLSFLQLRQLSLMKIVGTIVMSGKGSRKPWNCIQFIIKLSKSTYKRNYSPITYAFKFLKEPNLKDLKALKCSVIFRLKISLKSFLRIFVPVSDFKTSDTIFQPWNELINSNFVRGYYLWCQTRCSVTRLC